MTAGGGPPGGGSRGGPPPAAPSQAPTEEEVSARPLESLFGLEGKTALIVGGYGGIGRLVTELFARAGAAVAVAGRSSEKAEELAATLRDDGRKALGAHVDVASPASVGELVGRVVAELGGVDVLVNCAGVLLEAKAEEFGEEEWRQTMEINLGGAFWLSQAVGRAMIAAGKGGRIIQFSSTRGALGGRRGFSAYGASKAGVNLLVKQLATEWARHGITVNGIAPGFVATEFVEESARDPQFVNMLLNRIPLGRFGEPLEIAGVTLFLASPAASYVTGQILFVDGGSTASS